MQADISIIGGGLVGYTAALAFAAAGFQIILIEAKIPNISDLLETEGRAIALAYTSCILYQSLNIWPELLSHATPIHDILISQQKSFGKCRINADDYQMKALGYVVPATHMASCLFKAVEAHPNIKIIAPMKVSSIENHETTACINGEINTKLVLACDGTDSFAREYFDLNTTEKNYHQHAIVANVTLNASAQHRAYQRVTDLGVLALLPLGNQRMTSVLTLNSEKFDFLNHQSSEEYLQTLQNLLGKRTGLLSDLGKRFSYPLTWMQATDVVAGRTVLMGNAAHTISPVAAQGLNIALRDLAMLYDQVIVEKDDIGNPNLLAHYAQTSTLAQKKVMKFTDELNDWVKPQSLTCLRSAGLFALDHVSILKNPLAKSLMGLSAHGGRLMREAHHD